MGILLIPFLNGNTEIQKLKFKVKRQWLDMHLVDFHTSNILSTWSPVKELGWLSISGCSFIYWTVIISLIFEISCSITVFTGTKKWSKTRILGKTTSTAVKCSYTSLLLLFKFFQFFLNSFHISFRFVSFICWASSFGLPSQSQLYGWLRYFYIYYLLWVIPSCKVIKED